MASSPDRPVADVRKRFLLGIEALHPSVAELDGTDGRLAVLPSRQRLPGVSLDADMPWWPIGAQPRWR